MDFFGSAFSELSAEEMGSLPDFLVISAPKTGTTWLAENLGRHPQVFVSPQKGLKYFSHRHHRKSLDWYLAQFRAGIGKTKGEVSPSYSLLPLGTIRQIHELIPHLKLIFLMREPVDRAWSHARHSFACKEATFREYTEPIEGVSDQRWMHDICDDWNRLFGDYLGQLRRWLQYFPKDQIFLGFYETLAEAPESLLSNVLRFLGIDADINYRGRIAKEHINRGISYPLAPGLEQAIVELHSERACQLREFLEREFQMPLPSCWQRSLGSPAADPAPGVPSVRISADHVPAANGSENCGADCWDVSDERLSAVLASDRMREPPIELIERDFLGFNLVRHRRCLVALRESLGALHLDQLTPQWWSEQIAAGNAVIADDETNIKAQILKIELARWQSRTAALEADLPQWQSRVAALEPNAQVRQSQIAPPERDVRHWQARVAALEQKIDRMQTTLARVDISLRILASSWERAQAVGSKCRRVVARGRARLRSALSALSLW